ncbi:MAG: PAS domain S-box protein [Nitrospirota bacterium]
MGNHVGMPEGHHTTETIEVPAAYGKDFQELSQKLIEAAPDAMIFVEKGGRIAMVNKQMEKLFGYSREELIGKDLQMLIPERFRARHRENIARFFALPRTRPMGTGLKIYGLKKDGTEFRADISLSPLLIDSEVLVTAAIRDITERVRAEEQIEFDYHVQRIISTILKIALEPVSLDEQLDRSLELIISIPDPSLEPKGLIYLFDDVSKKYVLKARRGLPEAQDTSVQETRVPLEATDAACERQERVSGLQCEITHTGNPDAPYEMIYKKSDSFMHYCVPIHEGEKILGLISVFAKEWPGSKPQEEIFFRAVAHTLAIIIKRYQIESERKKLIERLTQTEKLAALGRISANVAHEIRNPLTVVGGFARRLQRRTPEETQEREYADFIITEVSRLEEILKDIVSYARATTLQLGKHRIHEMIDDVLDMYEEVFQQRSIAVRRSYGYTADILIDKRRSREVVLNIVSNAVDAMPAGGTLTVSTAHVEFKGEPFVAVALNNTGEIIPADKLDKIFEPFYTTKVAEQGIGLGLPISKKIMEDHGGFITAESSAEKGTTFTLYFPLRRST